MSVLLCLLLWSLVEVHSQTEFPYVFFMGETLPNHAYVDLTLVDFIYGNPGNTVRCITDLHSCCRSDQGPHRADWYFPNGPRLPFPGQGDIYEARGARHVEIHRKNNANSPSGIYRCDIPTNYFHDRQNISVREMVYVGLYASGGDITISGGMTFTVDSDLNGDSSQFTLTCISTGGPATTVTWTRGSETAVGERITVFNTTTAATTAQYTHTLTVTGRLGGLYTCTVANNKPSSDSAQYNVQEPGTIDISITSSPASSIMAGDTVSLTCSISLPDGETGNPTFQWEGPSGTPAGSRFRRWMVSSDLMLREITTSQAGRYACIVHFRGSERATLTLTVLVQVPAPFISIRNDTEITAGTTLNMTCNYTLPNSVDTEVVAIGNWMVNGSAVDTSQDGRISTDGATLIFSPLTTSDTGRYTCTLTITAPQTPHVTVQGHPQQSTVEVITVQIPQPVVAVTLSHTGPLYAGTGLTLTCTVTLDPSVDNSESVVTEWSGLQSIPEDRYSVTDAMRGFGSNYTGSLTISPLADQDDGTYTCTGTVTGGAYSATASDDITITVMRLPISLMIRYSDNKSLATAGSRHTLNCSISSIPYLVVPPTVQLIGPGDNVIAINSSFTVTHTLRPVTTSHAGLYICIGTVNISSVNVSVENQSHSILTVEVPQPAVVVTLNDTSPLYIGNGLTLTCTVTLDPSVDNSVSVVTEWSGLQSIPEDRYSVTDAMRVSGSAYTGSLTISPLADQDDGTYTCIVTVTGGTNVQSATASDGVTISVVGQPESVTIIPVSAEEVRVTWSNSPYHSTTVQYTSYFTDTGSIISHYKTVLPPHVNSTDVAIDIDRDGYEHNFTLQYISTSDLVLAPVTTATFAFDKKYFQIQFGPINYCLSWGLEKTGRIEDQLQSQLTLIIRERCTNCYTFSTDYLKQGKFLCHDNPTTVTYRSTLINPFPTTNSTELVGIIESWVSTCPSLILDGLEVRVSRDVPTCMASLDDGECVSAVETDSGLSVKS